MREVKFKVWDKENKEMYFTDMSDNIASSNSIMACRVCLDEMGWNVAIRRFNEEQFTEIKDFELIQYTGLKDCKGKEIYEGDVLAPDNTCRSSNRYIIEWNDNNCCFTSIEGGLDNYIGDIDEEIRYNMLSNMRLDKCEVIGSIYEYPELLKEAK